MKLPADLKRPARKTIHDLYAKALTDMPVFKANKVTPILSQMRGNPDSGVCIIAPPPIQEEFDNNLPLSGPDSLVWHSLLEEEGFDTERDSFIVTCSLYGLKPCKVSTTPIIQFVQGLVRTKSARFFICVGGDSFKYVFGRGKKPSMSNLAGSLILHQDIEHLPLFTFPDINGLAGVPSPLPLNLANDVYAQKRNLRFAKDFQEKQTIAHRETVRRLIPLLTKHK